MLKMHGPNTSANDGSLRMGWRALAMTAVLGGAVVVGGCGGGGGNGDGGTPSFTVSTSAGTGGSISPANASVAQGSAATFTITPPTGQAIASATGCGGTVSGNTYTTAPITAACTVTVTFESRTYTVTTDVNTGGSVAPGNATVAHGETAEFTVTVDPGFEIASVSGCGGTRSGATFVTGPVTANCIIFARFVTETGVPPGAVGMLDWLSPLPHGNIVNDLHVFNENRIIAVANNGDITLTTDGGITWERITSPSEEHLNSVFFVGNRGWIVGNNGTLLRSVDGGVTWGREAWGFPTNFQSVFFVDELIGWAVGGGTFGATKIIKSTDGGVTWSIQPNDTGTGTLYGVWFVNDQVGWLVGAGGTLARTTDGGQTWVNQDSGTSQPLRAVQFVDEQTGWIGGNGIMRTDDGGETWTLQTPGFGSVQHLHFLDANTGWAISFSSVMYTNNGGQTWTLLARNRDHPSESAHFLSATLGFGSGSGGDVMRSVDGCDNWTRIAGDGPWFNSMSFVSAQLGWGVGRQRSVYRTDDGGSNWVAQDAGSRSDVFNDVQFLNSELGWIVGDTNLIFRTTNGGAQWQEIPTGLPNRTRLASLHFVDAQNGWVVGRDVLISGANEMVIARTTDGGLTWQRLDDQREGDLRAVHFANQSLGWAVGQRGGTSIGDRGIILHTTNGGVTWQEQASGLGTMNDIHFVDAQYGWATGVSTLLQTSDGGATWSSNDALIGGRSGQSVFFLDRQIGWVVGTATIMQTLDGGVTWHDRTITTNGLRKVVMHDETVGWISGMYAVLKYTHNPD